MTLEELFRVLGAHGVAVSETLQREIAQDLHGERIFVRRPCAEVPRKMRVLEYGTSVPASFVARQAGCTVQYVRRIRRLLR